MSERVQVAYLTPPPYGGCRVCGIIPLINPAFCQEPVMRTVTFVRLRRLLLASAMGTGLMLAVAVGHVGTHTTHHSTAGAGVAWEQASLYTTQDTTWG